MDEVLEQLKDGYRRFRTEVYPGKAEQFRHAMSVPQKPLALVITCADSRIHPDVLMQSVPGELFVTRNIGNMVPAYGEMMGSVSAVLEYAVTALEVRHVVVCGHTDCGAMKALLDPASVEAMPTVKKWLRNAHTALSVAEALAGDNPASEKLLADVTEQNVLLQMQHVRTHPSVAGAIARGTLTVSGWLYDIGEGKVRICEGDGKDFQPVLVEDETTRRARVIGATVGAVLE